MPLLTLDTGVVVGYFHGIQSLHQSIERPYEHAIERDLVDYAYLHSMQISKFAGIFATGSRGFKVRFPVNSSKVCMTGSSSESEELDSLLSRAWATFLISRCLVQASVRARLRVFLAMTMGGPLGGLRFDCRNVGDLGFYGSTIHVSS